MQKSFIITAGGIGKRMGTATPKQFLLLAGKPVLMHTIENLHRFDPEAQLVLTLPAEHEENWNQLCRDYHFSIPHSAVAGGRERFHSIQHALAVCTGTIIAVHDGVRPFVSTATLERLFTAISETEAVIPVVSLKESLREVSEHHNTAVDRSDYKIVQTPQVFKASVLHEAYQQPFTDQITDDARLVEQLGIAITLVEGNDENIKLTTPSDWVFAEAIIKTM